MVKPCWYHASRTECWREALCIYHWGVSLYYLLCMSRKYIVIWKIKTYRKKSYQLQEHDMRVDTSIQLSMTPCQFLCSRVRWVEALYTSHCLRYDMKQWSDSFIVHISSSWYISKRTTFGSQCNNVCCWKESCRNRLVFISQGRPNWWCFGRNIGVGLSSFILLLLKTLLNQISFASISFTFLQTLESPLRGLFPG